MRIFILLNYWMMLEGYPKSQGRGWQFDSRLRNLLSTWQRTFQVVDCLLCFGARLSACYLKKEEDHWMMLEGYPKSQGRGLAIRFLTVKSPLYLTKNLPGGQLPHVLWCWPAISKKKKKKKSSLWSWISKIFICAPKTMREMATCMIWNW